MTVRSCAVFSFPLSGPGSDHQFSVEENEAPYAGKIHQHHHRRHTHSQDTLCHTHSNTRHRASPRPCDGLDVSQSLRKALETDSDSSPWPSIHINIDNKAEHKQLSEKSLQPPSTPRLLPDHLKCNILKAQMEAAFREPPTTPRGKGSSDTSNERYQSSSQDSAASSLTVEKNPHWSDYSRTLDRPQPNSYNINTNRRKRLVRQYSFNHEDEDNLPEALAAISAESATKSGSNSSLDRQIQPPIYPQVDNKMSTLELGGSRCPSLSPSPNLSPSFFRSSIPHLIPYTAVHNDSGEERLDREKILRALLMTEL